MGVTSTAGVEFVGNLMRYAEVEYDGSTYRLLRLGNCEFEFDVADVIYQGHALEMVHTIQNALKDVFKDTVASSFRFVLPSAFLTKFESWLPNQVGQAEMRSQIGFETHLLNGGERGGDIFPGETPTSSFQQLDGYCVQHVSQAISTRLKGLCSHLPQLDLQLFPSINATIKSVRKLLEMQSIQGGSAVLLGCYPGNTDFIVLKNGLPVKLASRTTPTESDRVYFAHETLAKLHDSTVGPDAVMVYGHNLTSELIELLTSDFGKRVSVLNPSPLVNLDSSRFEQGFPIQAFVPCLGASIS